MPIGESNTHNTCIHFIDGLSRESHLLAPCPQPDAKERHSEELRDGRKKERRQGGRFIFAGTATRSRQMEEEPQGEIFPGWDPVTYHFWCQSALQCH